MALNEKEITNLYDQGPRYSDMTEEFPREEEILKENPMPNSLLEALHVVADKLYYFYLTDKFRQAASNALAYLKQRAGLTTVQSITIACLIQKNGKISKEELSRRMCIDNITMLSLSNEIEELVERGWIVHYNLNPRKFEDPDKYLPGYRLENGVEVELTNNEVFHSKPIECEDFLDLIDLIYPRIWRSIKAAKNYPFEYLVQWIAKVLKANDHITLARVCNEMSDDKDKTLLVWFVDNYLNFRGRCDEGLEIELLFDCLVDDSEDYIPCPALKQLRAGTHPLMKAGWIEHKKMFGVADKNKYVLTKKAKEEFLDDYKPKILQETIIPYDVVDGFLNCKNIWEKKLYFNPEEEKRMDMLTSLLSKMLYHISQQRLEGMGKKNGFSAILYGPKGTGKTSAVYELARQTGRDIMTISIENFRLSSAEQTMAQFEEAFEIYRKKSRRRKVAPILFIKDLNRIFTKEVEDEEGHKFDAALALKPVLLKQLNKFDGILLVTTNMEEGDTPMFLNKFTFDIPFHLPTPDTGAKIWKSEIGQLPESAARALAEEFPFSGEQIEKISTSACIDFILNRRILTYESVRPFCLEKWDKAKESIKPF